MTSFLIDSGCLFWVFVEFWDCKLPLSVPNFFVEKVIVAFVLVGENLCKVRKNLVEKCHLVDL